MIKVGMVTIVVKDQAEALAFWTEKLGWEKRMDVQAGPRARWLTVGAPGQELSLTLWDPTQWMPAEAAQAALGTIGKGGSLVLHTDDCRTLCEELSARGVEFVQTPVERQYGVEAIFRDPSGNSFVLTEPRRG